MHGMLVGRKATQVENGAEEEWEISGIGPQVQEVESTVNACVMQLKFGDNGNFSLGERGQPTHLESLRLCMTKGVMALKLSMPLKIE